MQINPIAPEPHSVDAPITTNLGVDANTAELNGDAAQPPLRMAELLGSGRHGVVVRARETSPNGYRDIAVKIPSGACSLTKEAIALRRFAHPNIIEIFDGPTVNGALVLEFCDGGTLAQRIADRPLDLTEAHALLTSMIHAVEVLHRVAWVHGDISPNNIGLRSQRGPALFDFATARPADSSPIDEGTAEFAGPFRQADPRLDIRCLAATISASVDHDDDRTEVADFRRQLELIVERCDRNDAVSLDDLAQIEATLARTSSSITFDDLDVIEASRPELIVSAHDATTTTRSFGPRPDAAEEIIKTNDDPFLPRWCIVAAASILLALLTAELLGARMSDNTVDATEDQIILSRETAQESLQGADAEWSNGTGVLTITAGGVTQRLAVGRPGDFAAIADWNCDGRATLGIYRPSTSGWFTFDSWDIDSSSSVRTLAPADPSDGDRRLEVDLDPDLCARPVLR